MEDNLVVLLVSSEATSETERKRKHPVDPDKLTEVPVVRVKKDPAEAKVVPCNPIARKHKKRVPVTLDGYTYKSTEAYVETWEKEVKKGIKAKRARCVATYVNKKGEEVVCGKVFGRVPNCKRHVLVHLRKLMKNNPAAYKNNAEAIQKLQVSLDPSAKTKETISNIPLKELLTNESLQNLDLFDDIVDELESSENCDVMPVFVDGEDNLTFEIIPDHLIGDSNSNQ